MVNKAGHVARMGDKRGSWWLVSRRKRGRWEDQGIIVGIPILEGMYEM